MASRILVIPQFETTQYLMVFQHRMYASIRNTVRIFDLEFLFSNCSRKDNPQTHIIIYILIGMFNCNPMIPDYLKLVEYSQIYSHLCWPPVNLFTGQLRRAPIMYNGLLNFSDTTIWNHIVPDGVPEGSFYHRDRSNLFCKICWTISFFFIYCSLTNRCVATCCNSNCQETHICGVWS